LFERQIGACDQPAHQRANGRRQQARPKGDQHAIPYRSQQSPIGEDLLVMDQCQALFSSEARRNQPPERDANEDTNQTAYPDPGRKAWIESQSKIDSRGLCKRLA